MAKVKGPLLSLDAKGNIKGGLNFSHGRDSQIVRKAKASIAPVDRKTDIQLFNRDYWADIIAIWHELDTETKIELLDKASSMDMTAFNLYIKEYIAQRPSEIGNTRMGANALGQLL
jgi:hypothetical protein